MTVPPNQLDRPVDSHFSPWLLPLVYPLASHAVLPAYFGSIHIVGQENLPLSGPVILAPTHRSRWDAILVAYAAGRRATGRDLRFMVTADEVKGFQGWLIRRLGGFPINPRQPAIASLRYGVDILKQGEMMVIFPEGGIFRDQQIHPLKPGLSRLALQAESLQPGLGVKVVPMHLQYSDSKIPWRCKVHIAIGTPIPVADFSQGSAKQNAQHLTTELQTSLKQLAGGKSSVQPLHLNSMAPNVLALSRSK